jgi:hypothetical protein
MAEKYDATQYAARIKEKFPEYKNLSDMQAIKTHIDKYPGDAEHLSPLNEQQKAEFYKIEEPKFSEDEVAPISTAEAFAQGAGQGATFNFGEELGLQDPRIIREASKTSPIAYTAGEIVGGLPYDIMTGGLSKIAKVPRLAAMAQKYPALSKLMGATALEGGKGFVSGVGGGEEGSRLTSGLIGGTLSGGLTAGVTGAPMALDYGANYLATRGMMPTASQLEKLRIKSGLASVGESASDVIQRLGASARKYGLTSPFESAATRLNKVQNEKLQTGLLPAASEAKTRLISSLEEAGAVAPPIEEVSKRISTIPERLGVTTPSGDVMAIRKGEINPALKKIQDTLSQYDKSKSVYGMKPPEVNYQPPRLPVSGEIPLEQMTEKIPTSLTEMDKIARNLYDVAQLKPGKPAQVYRTAAKDIRSMVQEQAEPVAQQLGRGGELAQSNKNIRDLIQLQDLLKTQTEKEATLSPISFIPSTLGAGYTMASGGETSDYARNVLLANLLMRGRGYRAGSNVLGAGARATQAIDPLAEALSKRIGVQNLTGPTGRALFTGE